MALLTILFLTTHILFVLVSKIHKKPIFFRQKLHQIKIFTKISIYRVALKLGVINLDQPTILLIGKGKEHLRIKLF